MQFIKNKNLLPLIIAMAIAAIAVAYYIVSGRGSYDFNVRGLSHSTQIQKVDATNPQKIKITCKDGQNYEITFKEGQQNYDDLIFNRCGADGGVAGTLAEGG